MPEKTAIAVHACGFENLNEICEVAKSRLTEALNQAKKQNVNEIIISGGVPYQKGAELLAYSMGKWLIEKDVAKNFSTGQTKRSIRIYYATYCFDSSTDIQNILNIARTQQLDKIIAISSYWHLWVLEPLYVYWQKKLDFKGEVYVSFSNIIIDQYLTSRKTRVFYFFYAGLVRLAIAVRLFDPLDKFLSSIFSKRKNGYPVSGCS